MRIIVGLVTVVVLAHCAAPKPIPSDVGVGARLQGTPADTYGWKDLVKDRVLAPNITTLRGNPTAILGIVYTRVAANGDCRSTDASNYSFKRSLEFRRSSGCDVDPSPARRIAEKRVEGGASASLGALLGQLASSVDHAFELVVNEPTSVALKTPRECADFKALAATPLAFGTCEVNFVAGVTMTEVNYRTYKKVSTDGSASFSAIRIGETTYYNTSDFNSDYMLTVDAVDVSWLFGRDPTTGQLRNLPNDKIDAQLNAGLTAKGELSDESKRLHDAIWRRERASKAP